MNMEHWWNTDRGKLKYLRKTCPNATLSTINPTQTGLGLNPSLHCEKLATKCQENGRAELHH